MYIKLILFVIIIAQISCNNKQNELNNLRSDYDVLVNTIQSNEANLEIFRSKLKDSEERGKKLHEEAIILKGELDSIKSQNENLRSGSDSLKKEFEEYKNRYKISARNRLSGHSFEVLTLKSGKSYKNAKILKIEDDSIKIMHDHGSARVSVSDLESDMVETFAMNKSSIQTDARTAISAQSGLMNRSLAWTPSNIDDVADCSLMVWVKKITANEEIASGDGSAFLCNSGDFTYIYTNAHNLDGAVDVVFKHNDGTIIDDFLSVEIAKAPFGYNKEFGQGGDVIRIQLKKYRPKALRLATNDINIKSLVGSEIYITGNTKGRGVITKLNGIITEIKPKNIIIHNVPTQAGNSGSPIVRASDKRVIGILTWGMYDDEKPFHNLWRKQPAEIREGINSGPLLYDFEYEITSFDHLKNQRVRLNNTKKITRMLGLMDALVPTHKGLFVNPNQRVSGDYTVADILEESADHRVIKRLMNLHNELESKGKSNIPYSNRTILQLYQKAMQACTSEITNERHFIHNDVRQMHFFFQGAFEKSKAIQVCRAYENAMVDVLNWYIKQSSLSGDPLPLSERVRLPNIDGGFAKFLKNE